MVSVAVFLLLLCSSQEFLAGVSTVLVLVFKAELLDARTKCPLWQCNVVKRGTCYREVGQRVKGQGLKVNTH